jgi:hypothetical protein
MSPHNPDSRQRRHLVNEGLNGRSGTVDTPPTPRCGQTIQGYFQPPPADQGGHGVPEIFQQATGSSVVVMNGSFTSTTLNNLAIEAILAQKHIWRPFSHRGTEDSGDFRLSLVPKLKGGVAVLLIGRRAFGAGGHRKGAGPLAGLWVPEIGS